MTDFKKSLRKVLSGGRELGIEKQIIDLLLNEAADAETGITKSAENGRDQISLPAIPTDRKNEYLREDWRECCRNAFKRWGAMTVCDPRLVSAVKAPGMRLTKDRRTKIHVSLRGHVTSSPLYVIIKKEFPAYTWGLAGVQLGVIND